MSQNYLRRKVTPEALSGVQGGKFTRFSEVAEAIREVTKERALKIYALSVGNEDILELPENEEKLFSALRMLIQSGIAINHIFHFIEYVFPSYSEATIEKIKSLKIPTGFDPRTRENIIQMLSAIMQMHKEKHLELYVISISQQKVIATIGPASFGPTYSEQETFKTVNKFIADITHFFQSFTGNKEECLFAMKTYDKGYENKITPQQIIGALFPKKH